MIVFIVGTFSLILMAAVSVSVQPEIKKHNNTTKIIREVIEYRVETWGKCDWYYDKSGCLRMRKCSHDSKRLPGIWKPKDGVCAK